MVNNNYKQIYFKKPNALSLQILGKQLNFTYDLKMWILFKHFPIDSLEQVKALI